MGSYIGTIVSSVAVGGTLRNLKSNLSNEFMILILILLGLSPPLICSKWLQYNKGNTFATVGIEPLFEFVILVDIH